jgi:16S rRNA (guanine966-N2)-methyltransferase
MRVISGTARGTRLVELDGLEVRPTLDRVKESFFNLIGQTLYGRTFLDLFAGTGAMGIEALSRSAEKVFFVEKSTAAQVLIKRNLEKCRMAEQITRWQLMKKEALQALTLLQQQSAKFDYIYVDPPFADDLYQSTLSALEVVLKKDGWIIVEHFHKTELQESYGKLKTFKDRRLGDSCLTFFQIEL